MEATRPRQGRYRLKQQSSHSKHIQVVRYHPLIPGRCGKRMHDLDIRSDIKALPHHLEIIDRLPIDSECWRFEQLHSGNKACGSTGKLSEALRQTESRVRWRWPKRPIVFIGDPHADAEAFIASLVASGGVIKTGEGVRDFQLNKIGRRAIFVIGGDCLDKGPSNLNLLRAIQHLMQQSSRVKLLAGNHDVRLLMGIRALSLKPHPTTEHLFVRMGDKVIPLFKEIQRHYLAGHPPDTRIPSEEECRRRLFPAADWSERFPAAARHYMSEAAIARELKRMRRKIETFESACRAAGLSLQDVYLIAQTCRRLFLTRKGEFSWFYRKMQLAYRKGAFLFVHAGVDDQICAALAKNSLKQLNRRFKRSIKEDLFHFYFGPLANTLRTKYRSADLPLTPMGVTQINRLGIHALVQGHLNRTQGQRLALKRGLLHIESDVTLDRNSRHKEGLSGYGIGVTLIQPEGRVLGISTDYAATKVFQPERCL